MLPGFHAIENALLLLWRHVGETLQPVLQPHLLLRGKLAELLIIFKRTVLLLGRKIFVAAEPVSSMTGVARDISGRAVGAAPLLLLAFLLLMLFLLALRLRMLLRLRAMITLRWRRVPGWANDGVSSSRTARQRAIGWPRIPWSPN